MKNIFILNLLNKVKWTFINVIPDMVRESVQKIRDVLIFFSKNQFVYVNQIFQCLKLSGCNCVAHSLTFIDL